MSRSPADLFEAVTGIALSEFLARRGAGFCEILTKERVEALAARLTEYYQKKGVPSYKDGKLFAHVYDSECNYAWLECEGFAPPRVAPSIKHVQHTLLYAHGVETYDLLPGALQSLLRRSREGRYHEDAMMLMWEALCFWDAVRELHDCGIVRILPGIGPSAVSFGDIVDMEELLRQEPFQREFRDFVVESGVWDPWYTDTDLDALSSEKRAEELIERYLGESYSGGLPLATDIARAYGIAKSSNAALWLPSPEHWRYLTLLLKHGAPSPARPDLKTMNTMARIASLSVPGIGQLDAKTLSAVRRGSAVFEDWRTELGNALATFTEFEGFPEETQLREFRARLTAASADVAKGLRKEGGQLRQKKLLPFGVGLLGVGVNIGVQAATGSPVHASALLGGAAAAAATTGIHAAQGRVARRARATMAMVLAEPRRQDDG